MRLLLGRLFDVQRGEGEEGEMRFKSHLVGLFNDHLVNCGGQFREADASAFLSNWGEFSKADRLIRLFSLFDYYCSDGKYLAVLC